MPKPAQIAGLVAAGLVLIGISIGPELWRAWNSWRVVNGVKEARELYEAGQTAEAADLIAATVEDYPKSPVAVQLAGDIAAASENPSEIQWRRRLVGLSPRSSRAHLTLLMALLAHEQTDAAREALENWPDSLEDTPAYQEAQLLTTLVTGDTKARDRWATTLLESAPDHPANDLTRMRNALDAANEEEIQKLLPTVETLRSHRLYGPEAQRLYQQAVQVQE